MRTNRPLFVKRLTPLAELLREIDPKAAEAVGPHPNFVLESRATQRVRCREPFVELAARLARRGAGSDVRRSYRRRLGRTMFQRKWARAKELCLAATEPRPESM